MSNKRQDVDALRRAAKAKLADRQLLNLSARSTEELLYELQVDQIELEMQNENLREAQVEVEKSRERYVHLYDFAPVGYLTLSCEGVITEGNLTASNLLGIERKNLIRVRFNQFIVPAEQDRWRLFFLHAVKQSEDSSIELMLRRGDGADFYAQLSCLSIAAKDLATSIRITLTDITERKRLESALQRQQELDSQESERKKLAYAHSEWINALDAINDPIFTHDKDFRVLRCNKAYQQQAGIPFKQIIGQPYYQVFPLTNVLMPSCQQLLEDSQEELEIGGTSFRARAYAIRDEKGIYLYSVHILDNITEQKQAETAIAHANRVLLARSRINTTMVHATDESELMLSVCNEIVNQRGFLMAWVGYVIYDENKSIKVMASAGFDEGYLDAAKLIWSETEIGMGPSGRAVRNGKMQLCQDIAHDPSFLPWRDAALERGYAAAIALPLLDSDNAVFGILDVYADQANAFIPAEIVLLEELADDLSFGVRALRIRLERDKAAEKILQHLLQLQDSLDDTIGAIATIVEMRDPYTAGHQRRVANLACAIARQMGLDDGQVRGIQIAGIVHDLGKIQIPAEILSKPGKISDIEFGLIKQHVQAGFDVLKDINFPWPIAQIVLQHHERLDGSGYPHGIRGDDIILEARILSVADVVEAMSSHRPYRPGLGIDVALAEIIRGRGVHFDPAVADACLSVFNEQKYTFPD